MNGTIRPSKTITGPDGVKRPAPDTTWFFQVTLTSTIDKKTTRQTIRRRGFPSKTAAQRACRKFLSAAHDNGDVRRALIQPSAMPVGQYLDQWLDGRTGLKPSTAAHYAVVIRAWVKPTLGNVSLRALSGAHISTWQRGLRKHGGRNGKPIGDRAVNTATTILGIAIGDAVQTGLLRSNPFDEIAKRDRKIKIPTELDSSKVWTADDARVFLNAASTDRLAGLWTLMLSTGCRRGEALALRWDSLNLDDAEVTFSRNRTLADNQPTEGSLKNNKSRVVDLDPATVAALRRWRRDQLGERLAAGPAWADTGYVFTDEAGEPLHPGAVSRRFGRIIAELPVAPLVLHGLRHTAITLWREAGVPVEVAAQRAGHDPSIMLRIYSHPSGGKDAAARIGAALFG